METRRGGEPANSWRRDSREKSRCPWWRRRAVGNQTNYRVRRWNRCYSRRASLLEHDDGIAVSIRLTRVPAGPCCIRPVQGRACPPDTPERLFQGRRVYPNLILREGLR